MSEGTFRPPSDNAYVPPPVATAARPPAEKHNARNIIVGLVIAAVAWLYATGSLDEPLSSVGLNRHPCAENLFGNTMCGDELKSFCKEFYTSSNKETCDEVLSPDERPDKPAF